MLRKDTNASFRKTWQGVDERPLDDRELYNIKLKSDFNKRQYTVHDFGNYDIAWATSLLFGFLLFFSLAGLFEEEGMICSIISFLLFAVSCGLVWSINEEMNAKNTELRLDLEEKWKKLISSKKYIRINNASYCIHTTYRRKVIASVDYDWTKHIKILSASANQPVHILHLEDKDWYFYKDEFWITNENYTLDEIRFNIINLSSKKKRKTVEKAKKIYKPPKIKEAKKKPRKKERIFGPDITSSEPVERVEKQEIKVQEPTTPWSEEELHFAVEGYVDMLEMEKQNMEYDKVSIITMWREGVAGQPGPLYAKSREEIKKCMMNISFVLKKNSIEHVADYRPITGMNRQNITIENELIDFGILEKHSPSPKKPKVSKKTNKTSSARGSRDYMRSFLSSDAKSRYTANPKPKKSHTGKMKEQSEIAKLGYNLQISEHSRRIALKRCVTKLGLKKVVDTMVMTLKRFKTRTNADMSGAIAKSEKDLDWLKVTYPSLWKGKWRWPNYKEFGNR